MNEVRTLRVGMVGLGMIFGETYRPVFERLYHVPLYHPTFGPVRVELRALASRTGHRAERFLAENPNWTNQCQSFAGQEAVAELMQLPLDAICVATPDERHFSPALLALQAGKHLLVEKPSVLSLQELDQLLSTANENNVLGKVVYHKLLDPDHKQLRTFVADGKLRHVNNGYCSLLEPRSISQDQFAEWIQGRNPATYVAVHYYKLIDFSLFGNSLAALKSVVIHGQRGIVSDPAGKTWDAVQSRITYGHEDGRCAVFDVHTSWVHPNNFPGYVDQEVQFRFDNGVWNASQRKRGVEVTLEGYDGEAFKTTPNHHYNALALEPWDEKRQRGYGLEAIERFFHEVAYVEFGGSTGERAERLMQMRALAYNDLRADRNVVAIVQAQEAILTTMVNRDTLAWVEVNGPLGGLVLWENCPALPRVLYAPRV